MQYENINMDFVDFIYIFIITNWEGKILNLEIIELLTFK